MPSEHEESRSPRTVLSYYAPPKQTRRGLPSSVILLVSVGFAAGGAMTFVLISLSYRVAMTAQVIWAIFSWTFGLDFLMTAILMRMLIGLRRRLCTLPLVGSPRWLSLLVGIAAGAIRWGVPLFTPRFANGGELQVMWLFIVPIVVASLGSTLLVRRIPASAAFAANP